ncbi:vam6/Vps39-like protein isoform X1 [Gossypium australe]|uniref:Vam6/Vps39-like protein isoform X1 n=1 Tax=Gossypium australe TaxID=47621 RepID=A0A5B6UV13_9ROSI|nr:vam6/Vps39-like protein isoform X1 [Gossypium australe]
MLKRNCSDFRKDHKQKPRQKKKMVHSAYDSFELINNFPTKIDAVESYGSKLLVGCSDCSLRIYGPDSSIADQSPPFDPLALREKPYTLERTVAWFSKKALLSMKVLESKGLLLSLSESIAFHRLPNFETIVVIAKAKGANVYSWDDRRGFLCFARQKRVCIFRHDGRGFLEVKEFGVPDTVKSISWSGENICVGVRKDYMILNATSGALSEVFSSGKIAPPLVVPLPSGELILGKENIGVLVDQNGKLVQAGRICWSEAPIAVVIQKPYAIALSPRRVEIRFLRVPYPLIQTIVLHDACHLIKSNNAIVVASNNSVYGLFPVPLGAQIVQLAASGEFEEALALCKLLPPKDADLRAARERLIHTRYAHYLFGNGCYEEAMEHFLASQVDITYVLSLYPSIVLPKTTTIPKPEKLMGLSPDDSSGLSDDLETLLPQPSESDENAAFEFKKTSHNTLMALIKYLQKKGYKIVEKAAAEGMEEVVLDAIGDNFTSARSKKSNKRHGNVPINSAARDMAAILDTALFQALLLTGQPSAALELLNSLNYCDVKICEELLRNGNHYAALLELYKSNSMHRESLKLLHQLVEESKRNQSHAEEFCPEAIIEYLKVSLLVGGIFVALFALNVFVLWEHWDFWAIHIPLCGTDPMLVLEFSLFVLENCPTQTIELFLSGNIPAEMVNAYLKQHAPNMQGRYLELMLAMNENRISANLQNEMVQIFLSEVLEWYSELSAQQMWDEKAYSPTRKKLLSALESISGYNPEALLEHLPPDALFEERAILFGKMNQHELALSQYVHKLHVPELALAYCDRVYDSVSSGNLYLTLLQIYLSPRKTTKYFENSIMNLVSSPNTSTQKVSSVASLKSYVGSKKIASIEGAEDMHISPSNTDTTIEESSEEGGSTIMFDQVLDLLSRRWDRINGAYALKILPRETKLQNLLPFLGPLVKKSSEAYRNSSVIKSLRQTENLQVCKLFYLWDNINFGHFDI